MLLIVFSQEQVACLFGKMLYVYFGLTTWWLITADQEPYLTSLNRVRISGSPLLQKCRSREPVNAVVIFLARLSIFYFNPKHHEFWLMQDVDSGVAYLLGLAFQL